MPWSHSGVQLKRTWPIGPSAEVVGARWEALLDFDDQKVALSSTDARNPEATPTSLLTTGRLAAISSLKPGSQPEAIAHYGYRSFDRQWLIQDNRLMDRPRPELWRVRGPHQIYLATLTSTPLGQGPVLTATPYVPDLHHFRGSYGAKDIFPLWTDAGAKEANLAPTLLHTLIGILGEGIGPNELVQYFYGLGGTSAFSERFAGELALTAGPVHLPITKDRTLFDEVAALGKELLAWQTWGERYTDAPLSIGKAAELTTITGRPEAFGYDAKTETLTVGPGKIAPVSPEVWDFEVSGSKPLQKWLGYRKAQRAGRTSSPLDAITYDEWTFTDELLLVINVLQHTVDLTPGAAVLLDRVLLSEIFTAEELS
ncbi:hypothetical protein Q0F99_06690 [Rathayibacter oskolensis]|uniref:type ISP restriction/modification enzyme n=1 Tax=Rathayibacter oskolensis TaxID=1891671 RepID=UPI00265EEDBF|nr:type ISP restriction/modification enzyme [Rathayibacter oskolensis]WKK73393.1 hypothetical protein Q0F99_06690 [Rathayibacter oskolensis]